MPSVDLDDIERRGGDDSRGRMVARWSLAAVLLFAGVAHLTSARDEFQAQVPAWFPVDADLVVVASGIVEISLGLALVLLVRQRVFVGLVVAGFFIAVFPGNIFQWLEGTDAFGLDTGVKRFVRLFFQPLLVFWAAWSTGVTGLVRSRK